MKEFSEDIEGRMNKAFKSKAGKKYGLSDIEIEMRKIKGSSGMDFVNIKESVNDMERMAKKYITSQNANINSKFLKKNIA